MRQGSRILVGFSFALLLVGMLALPVAAGAKDKQPPPPVPEVEGDYTDPENPNGRVRVFIHNPKDARTRQDGPACTDPDGATVVNRTGWKLPSGSWPYQLNTASVPTSVGGANLFTIASNGFAQWQGAQTKVTFARGTDTTKTKSSYDGQNIVAWGRTSGTALAVTYVRYFTSTKQVVDVDTIMNLKFPWSWTGYGANVCGNPNSYDAQAVLTHEQGHWLGLDDMYATPYVNHTMYGYGTKGDLKADTLTTGDKAGAVAIYP